MKPPPFEGFGLTTTFDGPALSVRTGVVTEGLFDFVSCSWAGGILTGKEGTVSHPVAVISIAGEQPRQGDVDVKFGSEISW